MAHLDLPILPWKNHPKSVRLRGRLLHTALFRSLRGEFITSFLADDLRSPAKIDLELFIFPSTLTKTSVPALDEKQLQSLVLWTQSGRVF